MLYRLPLSTLALTLALGTLTAEDKPQAKVQAKIQSNESQYNPALFITQTKIEIEKPKVDPAKPAGVGVRVIEVTKPTDPKPKNSFLMGLGFSTASGVQLTAELTKDTLKRNCTLALPNLFFQIPAAFRKETLSDKKPAADIQSIDEEDPISLAGTQFLGRPETSSLDRSK